VRGKRKETNGYCQGRNSPGERENGAQVVFVLALLEGREKKISAQSLKKGGDTEVLYCRELQSSTVKENSERAKCAKLAAKVLKGNRVEVVSSTLDAAPATSPYEKNALKREKGRKYVLGFPFLLLVGHRGLEVRRHGLGPPLLVDFHRGRLGRHGGHHPASADALRRPRTHRHRAERDSPGHGQAHGRHQQGLKRRALLEKKSLGRALPSCSR